MTWFAILLAARYRGAAKDAVVDAAVGRRLITQDEADIIKLVPNGGFPAETSPAPAAVAQAESAPEA